ncbi:phospholipase D4 isoform X2 [Denticeps clupeoides]|nr:phospholipase D4 isoform X2 [Denticeps clupeoides]
MSGAASTPTLGLFSPYRSLNDRYVSNRRCSGRPFTILQLLGCCMSLGLVLWLSVMKKLDEEGPTHITETVDITDGPRWVSEEQQSRIEIVESIPLYMEYGPNATFGTPLHKAWKKLLSMATNQIEVASFYWSLTGEDIGVISSTDRNGREILEQLEELPSRNVTVVVVASADSVARNSTDLTVLKQKGAYVREVNFKRLTGGILHSKFWIIDRKHIYIGSANMDWRSLTQVKELGVIIYNSFRLAEDLSKIFASYWMMGKMNSSIPQPWPAYLDTLINQEFPLHMNLNSVPSSIYISASPPVFCTESRTRDLDAVLSAIQEADRFISIAVMDYFPSSQFSNPARYWPDIDDALKESAIERNIMVRLLVSCGRDTHPAMLPFLESLVAIHYPPSNISMEVKVFIVPVGNQTDIPYSRVNHNKYMVTDKVAYIGNSNWSEEYFTSTAGVGLMISRDVLHYGSSGPTFQQQLKYVFDRDWNSPFTVGLSELANHPDCSMSRKG